MTTDDVLDYLQYLSRTRRITFCCLQCHAEVQVIWEPCDSDGPAATVALDCPVCLTACAIGLKGTLVSALETVRSLLARERPAFRFPRPIRRITIVDSCRCHEFLMRAASRGLDRQSGTDS